MEGMTIKEIAGICDVSESTVRNWIGSAEIAKPSAEIAKATNEPFRFNLIDTLKIIRAGGRSTLADLLQENAGRRISDVPDKSVRNKTSKLTGALAREYRLAAEHDLITIVQFQQLIGLSPSSLTNAPPPPFLMLPEQISEEEKGVRAWTRNVLNKRRRKDEDTRDQSKLDFDDN